jgi:hypothetical protein
MTMKAILTLAGAAFACALAAAPATAAQDGAPKKSEQIFIIERAGGHGDATGPEVRRFHLDGDAAAACAGNKDEVNEVGPDGKQHTRILVCTGGQLSAAERADKLEHVLSRIETSDDLSADQKARVTANLRATIDKLRSGQ